MELIKNFGFDPYLFAAQIVNFLIVLYILKRFLYKPVLDLLNKRRHEVTLGLKNAEEGRKLLEDATEKEREILRIAQQEAKKLVDQAKKESDALTHKMMIDAQKRTEKMIADAKQSIEQEREQTEKRLTGKVSEVAVDMLEKSLKEFFGEKEQKDVMTRAMKKMKKTN